MICTTIINKDLQGVLSALAQCEMAEIRLDSCDLSMKDIDEVFSSDVPLVATCRISEVMSNEPSLQDPALTPQSREIKAMQIAERKLVRAVQAGARYVDVEMEAQKQMSKRVRNAAHESGTVFIRSYHDFTATPSVEELRGIVEKCRYHGADMVKLVTMAKSQEDVDRVMSLYEWCDTEASGGVEALADGGLIAFCMGEAGRQSRIDALAYGAPYTYAALTAQEAAAPGQWPMEEMASKIYGDFRMIGNTWDTFAGKSWKVQPSKGGLSTESHGNRARCPQTPQPRPSSESSYSDPQPQPSSESSHSDQQPQPLRMPCSKSFAQRAIIAAALADGVSHLKGYSPCGDNEAALTVARNLGAEIQQDGTTLTIKGISASLGSLTHLPAADTLQCLTGVSQGQTHLPAAGTLQCLPGVSQGQTHLPAAGASHEDCNCLYEQGHADKAKEQDVPVLHVGESGLLTRMMIPLMAQLCPGKVKFTGEKTLLGRPLTGAKEIMDVFGVEARSCDGDLEFARDDSEMSGPDNSDNAENGSDVLRVPLTLRGPLKPGRADISGKHGSQIISGLLMALPFSDRNSTLVVHTPKSIPYMFITLEVLKKFGIKTGNEMLGGRDFLESDGDWSLCTEMVFKIKGGQKYKAADIDLEGDWSAAANFLVAGAIFGKVQLEGLDTTSLQADLSIMDVLMDAGASLSQTGGDRGEVTVQRAPLKSFCVDASNCPDLFPIISILAAFCQGTSRLKGVGRLANKESNRAAAIVEMLTRMGVRTEIQGDEMVIEGCTLVRRLLNAKGYAPAYAGDDRPVLLRGGSYTSHHDHRMVMALKVASIGADSPIIIDDEQCVSKSFPQFHEMFEKI